MAPLRYSAFLGTFAGTVRAQGVIDARVPFAFVVGNQEFPAGRYEFTESQHLLAMRGKDNGAGLFALTLPADGRDPKGDRCSCSLVTSTRTD